MASNCFGNLFKITTWGESHGKAIGVVIDGCPAGISLSEEKINRALARRAPGRNALTSPRREADIASIYSGVFDGHTTGAPISIIIPNTDPDSSKYEDTKDLLKPGHANYTYLQKYGCFDYRGGGRASARETACRVAAGAVATELLNANGISVIAYINSIGTVDIDPDSLHPATLSEIVDSSLLWCPDSAAEEAMVVAIEQAKAQGDSLGGTVGFSINGLPAGLGDPVYEKIEANLARAMMSIPATKGFEIGEGFSATRMRGSEHNDVFSANSDAVCNTNHAGGSLGGISTGMPLTGRVACKPTSSIQKQQRTVDTSGNPAVFQLPEGSRHDPCVAIRAVPVVSAMCAIVIADAILMNRCATLDVN